MGKRFANLFLSTAHSNQEKTIRLSSARLAVRFTEALKDIKERNLCHLNLKTIFFIPFILDEQINQLCTDLEKVCAFSDKKTDDDCPPERRLVVNLRTHYKLERARKRIFRT